MSEENFFNKNGTVQGLLKFAENEKVGSAFNIGNSIGGLKSSNGSDRLGSLLKLVTSIVAMCA